MLATLGCLLCSQFLGKTRAAVKEALSGNPFQEADEISSSMSAQAKLKHNLAVLKVSVSSSDRKFVSLYSFSSPVQVEPFTADSSAVVASMVYAVSWAEAICLILIVLVTVVSLAITWNNEDDAISFAELPMFQPLMWIAPPAWSCSHDRQTLPKTSRSPRVKRFSHTMRATSSLSDSMDMST
ncbi:hypothetical protein PF001_g19078 [Phytophthora fragariae]|uniref:CNNM transmembrane domain-containing protein n=1 Tax=Phytophthora fragariae TaxID=53985 RepID=A0A6A4CSP7_9STRA|nr:hypothetical protein PF001_g19078 [Phytophthora fragariae]